jgi:hypothetical protein
VAEARHKDREHLSGILNSGEEDLAARTKEFTAGTPQRYISEAVGVLSADEKDEVKRLLNEN